MTEQERVQLFINLMTEATKKTGVTVKSKVTSKQLGEAFLTEPGWDYVLVQDWKPDQIVTEQSNVVPMTDRRNRRNKKVQVVQD